MHPCTYAYVHIHTNSPPLLMNTIANTTMATANTGISTTANMGINMIPKKTSTSAAA